MKEAIIDKDIFRKEGFYSAILHNKSISHYQKLILMELTRDSIIDRLPFRFQMRTQKELSQNISMSISTIRNHLNQLYESRYINIYSSFETETNARLANCIELTSKIFEEYSQDIIKAQTER